MSRTRNSDQIRSRLLVLGLKCFANRGYHGTGIKEIVDAAEIPKGSFYNYFKSKEDFSIEIMRMHSREFWDTWHSCFDATAPDPLDALCGAFERMIAEHAECAVHSCGILSNLAAELSEHSEACKKTIDSFLEEWRTALAEHIRGAQDAGIARTDLSCDDLAILFWDAWHGALIRVRIHDSVTDLQRTVRLMLQTVMRR